MKPVAIIPARGGSKRIPRKNIIDMNGLPMMAYPIKAAIKSSLFEKVIVSSEDEEIKNVALSFGAEVIDRPQDLATDTAFEIEIYEQVLNALPHKPEYFCAIYPTAILLDDEDFIKSYDILRQDKNIDVLMSVSAFPIHPFKALKANDSGYLQMVHPKECLMRSQTYPEYVASNGTFYWFKTDSYFKYKSYYAPCLKPYFLPRDKSVDIDVPEDLVIARALLNAKSNVSI